jgi:hypothetical protein
MNFEDDARQRPGRRTGELPSGVDVEEAFVTRTTEHAFSRFGYYGA